ncbi:MAG: ParB N-terminal domain-containing protein, partial [Desulfobacterales bacterium]|nr:ParB N-terminal domain-containing protein [Desulfobacterales bacterium]
EVQEQEAAFDTRDRGARVVPLDRIVGSVGRYHDFDKRFRMRSHLPADRLEEIKNKMRAGKALPPVKLYQIKNEYFALDGNHRIAAAKELGYGEIQARIIEFIPSKGSMENLLYREKAQFDDCTQLPYTIELTDFGQYQHLIEQISRHRDYLEKKAAAAVALQKAAKDWYETIYEPLIAIIEKGRLGEYFPGRTLADLYTFISVHQWERKDPGLRYGIGISQLVPKNMEDFRKKMAKLKETEYPEMLREIIAFVLINASAKKEVRLVDKLIKLEEVKEVHSVHGNVDIIAKIVLRRDLVSSDAETIGDFVHNKIRQLSGVISTQTLIPGYSKLKKKDEN